MFAAANRDPRKWTDPERFDVRRPNTGHLGFGFGQHVCLGQRLAELQLKVAFETLFERLPNLRPVSAPRRLRSNFINGIKTLAVDF